MTCGASRDAVEIAVAEVKALLWEVLLEARERLSYGLNNVLPNYFIP